MKNRMISPLKVMGLGFLLLYTIHVVGGVTEQQMNIGFSIWLYTIIGYSVIWAICIPTFKGGN